MQEKHYNAFSQALVDWFTEHGRDYPWRRTTNPWEILVSEVMLQQTTIATVLGRYEAWLRRFPTPEALAAADEQTALHSWEGLGYYRRVRSLQAAAIAISERHGGRFPEDESAIRALPGIGDYTVGAVLSFAYNRPAPLVDANVSRVFARVFNDTTPIDSNAGRKRHWQLAARLVHRNNPRAYNSALMELGQTICTTGSPTCLLCPVREYCTATQPEKLPIKLPRKQSTLLEHWDIWHLTTEGLLLEKQPDGKRHEGMYRLPRREQEEVAQLPHLCDQKYSVTRYKVTRHLYRADHATPRAGECHVPLNALPAIPMASPDRKLLQRYLHQSTPH
ncbi:MAG: A/G-specific adenine glycosylase [Akkermansia sp.]|nr:A/G-specific adenine glycosylase [Akkermansia sp.]